MLKFARALIGGAVALALLGAAGAGHAQAWPSKPIKIVAPVPPGGGVDFLSRAIAQRRLGCRVRLLRLQRRTSRRVVKRSAWPAWKTICGKRGSATR